MTVLSEFDLEQGWMYFFCKRPEGKYLRRCGLRGKTEDMLKVFVKQEGPCPVCLEGLALTAAPNRANKESWSGAQLVSPAWGSFPYHILSGLILWSSSRPLRNDIPETGSRRHPSEAEPVGSLRPAQEPEERRKILVASPAEIRTAFGLGSGVWWSLHSGPSFMLRIKRRWRILSPDNS